MPLLGLHLDPFKYNPFRFLIRDKVLNPRFGVNLFPSSSFNYNFNSLTTISKVAISRMLEYSKTSSNTLNHVPVKKKFFSVTNVPYNIYL